MGTESIIHLLADCDYAKACWNKLHFYSLNIDTDDFQSWLCNALDVLSNDQFCTLSIVCWNIWNLRNNIIWKNWTIEFVDSLIFKSKSYYSAWLAMTSVEQHNRETDVPNEQWKRPQQGFMKMNVDAAINIGDGCMGVGCVLRDDQGVFVAARSANWRGVLTSREAEALAIRDSLIWLRSHTESNILVETDSQQVVQCYNSNLGDSSFHLLLADIKNLMSMFAHSSLVFVKRSANQAAHLLVRQSVSVSGCSEWFMNPPLSFVILSFRI
ncbi:PREDICTED: uncharacterized protein LOC109162903 [Ipomoea nil]|uniref:uncharacterized protein LOC109162903 n=1 Tax=Ipomoea nil TaxID=35883 RepID=UPI000900EFD5|nr:PREDICTED: uncharacterized protein LOC109162903 [Ipomoea nil]